MVSIATQTTSVISGRLELSTKYFVHWSLCLNNVFASNVYIIGGYPFHIEIHSNPSLGYAGYGNEYFLPVNRKFAILLVSDYSFPEPTQSLECNFDITLKAKNPMYNDIKLDYSNAFSAYNRAGGCVLSSEYVANPNNGLLSHHDTLSIAIDVQFAPS
ncbi:hypothetical protein DdX_18208 [Ditylenchus destructor]|uniref:Uncharacterized protein n=1 Tax=Ditylenchus destructor TaxID=166010 RepID=A0AAD4MQH9_9BILA|nr:hypothetical protein DdX_18208 [Ditylenchus destructor]